MACRESSLIPGYRCHNNPDELDVFQATRYFSGYTDGGVLNHHGYCIPLPDNETRQLNSRVATKSLDVPTTIARVASNGAIVKGDQGCVSKEDKMPRQPSSPGGKIVSFMKSLFKPSSSAEGIRGKKVRKTKVTRSMKVRDEINPGGWRRSSIGHFWTLSAVADSKSLPRINMTVPSFSYVNSCSRTPPPSSIVNVPWDSSRIVSHHRQAAASVSIRNRAREEFAKSEASHKVKKEEVRNPSNNAVDCDDDGNESDSNSDLFELPVYDSTRIDSVRRSSMSTVSTSTAMKKLHV